MAHLVKCPKCGKQFDRDKVQAVKVSARRYGHASCYPDNKDFVPLAISKENPDLVKLKEYISKKYGNTANWALINKQIKKFTKEKNYSLSGILKSLVWFYDVKGNSVEKSNGGIGICEYCYNDAYNYYYNLFLAQSRNEGKDITKMFSKTKEITISPPQRPIKKRFFSFVDNDEDEVVEE